MTSKIFFAAAIFLAMLQIFAFCVPTAYAQKEIDAVTANDTATAATEDVTEGSSHDTSTTEEEEGDGESWGSLLKSCPLKITRLTPCIDTENDLSQCTSCVTDFVTNSDVLSSSTSNGDGDDNSSNTTSAVCDDIQTEVCSGVETCGESCGLITSEGDNGKFASFFQFGSNCESLFLDLVMCALEAEEIITEECSMETCGVNGTDSSAASLSMSSTIATMSVIVSSGVALLF